MIVEALDSVNLRIDIRAFTLIGETTTLIPISGRSVETAGNACKVPFFRVISKL